MSELVSAASADASTPTIEVKYLADSPELIPLLAEWHHRQWGHLPQTRTLEQRTVRLNAYLQRQMMPTMFVAWADGIPVGSASLIANDMPELAEWIPWLSNVYVVPQLRRRGVGKFLVERVAAEAVALGYPRLYLYTLDQMHFYEQLGWHFSHLRFYRGHDMTVMTRDLIVNPPAIHNVHVAPKIQSV